MQLRKAFLFVLLLLFPFFVWATGISSETPSAPSPTEKVVNVYSSRNYDIDKIIYSEFTKKTGIKVNLIASKEEELIARISAEGKHSDLDLLFFTDAGRLARATSADIVRTIEHDTLFDTLRSPVLKDPKNKWIAITMRARVIAYNQDKGKPDITSYEDLARDNGPKVLVRSSSNIYNISLLSFLIDKNGFDPTMAWTKGLVKNLARHPEGNDRDQMRALVNGLGDVAIVNSYYVGLLIHSDIEADREVGKKIGLIFPTPTHINISGVAIGRYSKHLKEAYKLLEYLLSKEVQELLAKENYEYPVTKSAQTPAFLKTLGTLILPPDDFDLNVYNTHSFIATQIADESGWY